MMTTDSSPPDTPVSEQASWVPALTLRSFLAAVLGLLVLGLSIQGSTVWLGMLPTAEYGLPLPAVVFFVGLLAAGSLMVVVFRRRLLTRAEIIAVFYVLVLAAPLMTQGFWHRVLSITATMPRTGDFTKLSHLSDRLWPHGPNLLESKMPSPIVLEGSEGETLHRISLPVGANGSAGIIPGEPYLLSLEVRATGLSADGAYFVRAVREANGRTQELFQSRQTSRPGTNNEFVPLGAYGVIFSGYEAGEAVIIEWGLQGAGRVEIRNAQLMNVSAVEFAYTGMEQVSAEVYDALPLENRAGLLRRPAQVWSWDGLVYFFGGGFPFAAWAGPLAAWGGLMALILVGAFVMNVLMRRQWIDGERYPLPLARIPAALAGEPGSPGVWGAILNNRGLWAGAALGLAWGLLKGLSFYNPSIPDTAVKIDLSPYFGPAWGGFWTGVSFEVVAIFVAVAVFVELNVLMSLVVGFFAYRALFWLGSLTGMSGVAGYPFGQQQQTGAFLVYGILVLVLAHKHIRQTLREAWNPSLTPPGRQEVISYRTAYLLLIGVLLGGITWAWWVGVSASGMLIFLGFMVLVAMVSSKFRAEAGVPFGYFTPANAAMVLLLLGGIPVFGADLVLMTFVASFIFSVAVFFLIPGAQLEMMELGRMYRMRPRDLLIMAILGLVGGLLVGGWIFLGHAYAAGGDAMRYTWAFDSKAWFFSEFNSALSASTAGTTRMGGGWEPSTWAYVLGGLVTAVLAILRQIFAGFWMHPIGFVLGPSYLSQVIWGSLLVAWFLRFIFVRIGGGLAVRSKLQPFFIGVFLGAVFSWAIWFVTGCVLQARGVEMIYGGLP